MKTLILPGFSLPNKDWAEKIKKELAPTISAEVIYWPHWKTGKEEPDWIETEADKLSQREGHINILAKSIGTAVAMVVLKLKPELINKLILCGIPLHDLSTGDEIYYEVLKRYPEEKLPSILCIQNENDPHATFSQVEKFIHALRPEIKILSKPGDNHEYPYTDDFTYFFLN